jgi:hypothetical protein
MVILNKDTNAILGEQQRIDLAALIKANKTDDCTQEIRSKKQSIVISNDVKHLVFLKQKYERLRKSNPVEFDAICVKQCSFLFNNYTDLYNKILNDKLDLAILERFLTILKKIEDGEIDQHEGSYLVGTYLKEMYIDSALKTHEKLDAKADNKKSNKSKHPFSKAEKKISYKDFKELSK